MDVLQDKVVVITGSSRGFGLAVAQAAAAAGARVVVSSRTAEAVEAAVAALQAAGGEARGVACDVGDLAQVEALADFAVGAYGRFDVWINNAGYAPPFGATAHVPPAFFTQAVQTNVIGSYNGSLVALRAFLPAGRGKLINILGRGDNGKPVPMQNGYASTKSWLRSFTLSLAQEYRDSGVGIFALNPGMMTTEFLTDVSAIAGYEDRLQALPTVVRMWAKPPEIPAAKAVWLASPATDGKTGLVLREMTPGLMIGGALREGWRRLAGQAAPAAEIKVTRLPAALPPAPQKR